MKEGAGMQRSEFDVVVVGAGPGGMSAAVAAADHGASVVVLEALDEIGGNASWSTDTLPSAASTCRTRAASRTAKSASSPMRATKWSASANSTASSGTKRSRACMPHARGRPTASCASTASASSA
ncbi:MAG: FAD-dependent oxidoreductase [Betaproteobacteria bacterium]|nr:FAD-dependent oxidoreductase [Betaproteobacteria bacterium]